MDGGFHEWACFSAQQAAEKAVKAVYQRLGADAWGHSIGELVEELPEDAGVDPQLVNKARSLDLHYIPPRYPNSVPHGIPGDYYSHGQAEQAIGDAEEIIAFCEGHLLP